MTCVEVFSFQKKTQVIQLKVTVPFETEANGQNEIVSHIDRSEVKL